MKTVAEVVIIGAGIIGASIAYHLAKADCCDVIVLEKGVIGMGSTAKCGGGIRKQFSTEVNIRLSVESVEFFERFEEETGHVADFRQYGYLLLASTESEIEGFRQNVALQRRLGVEVYLLSSREAKEMVPQLNSEDIVGATYCPTDGFADPYSVVQGFASAAKRRGVTIYEETEVTDIKLAISRVHGVSTSKGEIWAPIVVNAAGPYAGQVGKMVGLNIPIHVTKRHTFFTGPSDRIRKDSPFVLDLHTGFVLRREGPVIMFGMREDNALETFDTTPDWGCLPAIAEAGIHRFPFLENVGIMGAQAGLHDDTLDHNAILGEAPGVDGLYLACGSSGHGFQHSPAIGKLMADCILDGKHSPALMSLGLGRFKHGSHEEEQAYI